MIQKNELLNLADLARIGRSSIDDTGVDQINSILGYMENLQSVPRNKAEITYSFINSVRGDDYEIVSEHTRGLLISNFPESERDYNKVQKILIKRK